MLLGISKVVITPPVGIRLAGFGHRDHGSESVSHDLELRTFWMEDPQTHASQCIITADLIGFDAALVEVVRKDIANQLGLTPENFLLAASHTHSGPQTASTLHKAGGPADPEYLTFLRSKLLVAINEARSQLQEVDLHLGTGSLSGYSINRRLQVGGKTIMAPNPAGVRDDEVTVIAFRNSETKATMAVLFHFTCHPTVLNGYAISPDFPGAARRFIEQALPDAAVGFLQGCCGDVRPNCVYVGNKRFRPGVLQEADMFGAALGTEVVRVIEGSLQPLNGKVNHVATSVQLPFAQVPDTVSFSIHRFDLAAELSLITMGGEVCCDYGLFVKTLNVGRKLLPVAYANGLVGYIPPARYFPEGGYEPHDSVAAYDLPSQFHPSLEETIRNSIRVIAVS